MSKSTNADYNLVKLPKKTSPLPALQKTLQAILDELRTGRGVAMFRGFSTGADYTFKDLEKLYWGLCTHLGTGVT